jgi:LuxR family transcriptional regulator, maltose regulon positive regulatory protein
MSGKEILTPSVDRSRLVPPAIPSNAISRKHLFHLFETDLPGVTVVAAPAGFGKSSLVSQWAQSVERPTVWFSIYPQDSMQTFFAHVLEAIRIVFPGFASDFENEPSPNALHNIKKLTSAVAGIKNGFNFVLNNAATDNPVVADFSQALIDHLPDNVHLVIIRRVTPTTSLARYASLGNLSLITSQDLKFSPEEVSRIADLNGADITNQQSRNLLEKCDGWPAAVQMITRAIARGTHSSQFEIESSSSPLAILALETINSLNAENKSKISRLVLLSEFDLETAAIVLGEDFSESYINKLATDGLYVSVSSGTSRIYRFNDIVYEILSQQEPGDPKEVRKIHEKLATHFWDKRDYGKALEHVYQSGDKEKFQVYLDTSIRHMAVIGRGDQLLKWAEYSGDSTPPGEMMKKTIRVVGHLVNLEFARAEALATELEVISEQSKEFEFLTQLTSMAFAHIYFARGEFTRSLAMINRALTSDSPYESIENTDRIALLRLKAGIHFLYDQPEEINDCLKRAKSLLNSGNVINAPYYITCMTSMSLWCEGRFFEAAEHAAIAINQATIAGYTSISAPHDVYMVLTRCQLELSQLDKAVETSTILFEKSSESNIWPWALMAEGTRARINITKGQIPQMMEIVKQQRERLATLKSPHEMSWLVDMTEVFLRFILDDWERAEELLRRMPKIEMVRQIDLNAKFQSDPKKIPALVAAFPENTPREKVNKYLYQATINVESEHIALGYLNKALEVGAEVGYHEYFVRQHRLYPIMVKAAAAQPTVFRESVVHVMTERIQAMNSDTGALEEKLTSRELEILKHLTTGVPLSAIAKQLHISQNTMKTHLRNVYRKLGVDGRHTAVEKGKKLLLI